MQHETKKKINLKATTTVKYPSSQFCCIQLTAWFHGDKLSSAECPTTGVAGGHIQHTFLCLILFAF